MHLRSTSVLPKTFESIQALRAIAALFVTFFHLSVKMDQVNLPVPWLRCFKGGFGGVDLFFIISGFIITHTNLSKLDSPTQLLSYFKKRLVRIYSIYWLIFGLAGLALFMLHHVAPSLQWLSYPFNLGRIARALTLLPTHDSILPVTWTLSHELYFYLLFGLVVASRFLVVVPIVVLTATLVAGLAALAGQSVFDFWLHDFLLSPFNLEFGFGILAYFLVRRFSFPIPLPVFWVAVLAFFGAGELVDSSEIWLRVWCLGIPATVILLGLVGFEQSERFRYPAWLLRLGDASYVLYLIHIPAIMVLTHALLMLLLPQFVLVGNFVLIGVLCWLSGQIHQRVEKPMLVWIHSGQYRIFGFKYRVTLLDLLRASVEKILGTHKMTIR